MKTMSYSVVSCPSSSRTGSVSPNGRVRKARIEERREKQKVEATLRRLVGSSEDCDQIELIHQIMSYIQELQNQLQHEKENPVPSSLDSLFSSFSASQHEDVVCDKENSSQTAVKQV